MRKNKSRSKELIFLKNIFKENLDSVKKYLEENPKKGTISYENKVFQYGDISRLLPYYDWEATPLDIFEEIKEYYHLDTLKKDVKESIEKRYNMPKGILVGKSKADMLLIFEDQNKLVLSYKDSDSKATKLGQVSGSTFYKNAFLQGGFLIEHENRTPPDIQFEDSNTGLSESQRKKLNIKHLELAYIKTQYPTYWNDYVCSNINKSKEILQKFGNTIKDDFESFITFINLTLFGIESPPPYFGIMMDDKIINSDQIYNFFTENLKSIEIKDFYTQNKYSLIIEMKTKIGDYYLCKIEPAFDGAKMGVSQTKGVIYYFQQYPTKGNHIWSLLKKIK